METREALYIRLHSALLAYDMPQEADRLSSAYVAGYSESDLQSLFGFFTTWLTYEDFRKHDLLYRSLEEMGRHDESEALMKSYFAQAPETVSKYSTYAEKYGAKMLEEEEKKIFNFLSTLQSDQGYTLRFDCPYIECADFKSIREFMCWIETVYVPFVNKHYLPFYRVTLYLCKGQKFNWRHLCYRRSFTCKSFKRYLTAMSKKVRFKAVLNFSGS